MLERHVGLDLQRPIADHADHRIADLDVGAGLGQALGHDAGIGRPDLGVVEVDLGQPEVRLGGGDGGLRLAHLGLGDDHFLPGVVEARLIEGGRFLEFAEALVVLAGER